MQIRECEYVLAIAQAGTMGKAAQSLYVTQPTLSKMLSKLEESVGSPLFERQSTGMVPTPVGEAYIQCAQRMIELNTQLEEQIKSVTGKQPVIDLGLPAIRSEMMTRTIFPRLSRLFPGMVVHYIHASQNKLVVDLLNNRYSLGVGILSKKYQHILNCSKVGEEEYVEGSPEGAGEADGIKSKMDSQQENK